MVVIRVLSICIFALSFACNGCGQTGHGVKIILDTDAGPDYDDIGAMAVLHALADEGRAEILAAVSSNRFEQSTRIIDAVNTYYGRGDIPIGATKDPSGLDVGCWHRGVKWCDMLVEKYPNDQPVASQSEDAVTVYRKALAAERDSSVVIVTIGFMTNLKNLLSSPPDDISPLDGKQLAAVKVRKLVSMGGRFPTGTEYNLKADLNSSRIVFEQWPTPVTFSGAEIGRYIRTGDKLIREAYGDSPVGTAYAVSIPQDMEEFENSRYEMGGRASYDQTAVLAGVLGEGKYFDMERGRFSLGEHAETIWEPDPQGNFTILKTKYPYSYMAEVIEEMMMRKPRLKH